MFIWIKFIQHFSICELDNEGRGKDDTSSRGSDRRGGVKRILGLNYEETNGVMKVFFENIIRDAVTYTVHAKHSTLCTHSSFKEETCFGG